ncbi:hypothetical protein MRX96_035705 [Rhipicephalus microplus]
MAPSRGARLLCSCPFFGKQQFFRYESCSKRVHAKCVTWPDDELQLLKPGLRSFHCNLCDLSRACGKINEDDSAACSDEHCSSQTGSLSTYAPPGGDLAGLRRLLLDALEGISFLSDEVSQLREENECLRKDDSRGVEQLARVVASLRAEVRFLREELTRRTAAMAVTAPVITPGHANVDRSVTSKQPAYSTQPLSNILSSSHSAQADADTSERVKYCQAEFRGVEVALAWDAGVSAHVACSCDAACIAGAGRVCSFVVGAAGFPIFRPAFISRAE